MEEQWQLAGRRRRGKPRRARAAPSAPSSRRSAGEAVEPVAEVSAEKLQHVVARVRAIADVLRHSLLVSDALREITTHFTAESTAHGNAVDDDKCASAEAAATATATSEAEQESAADDARSLELVGYGLGSFCVSSNAVHQLGFLVALRDALARRGGATNDDSSSGPSSGLSSGPSSPRTSPFSHLRAEIFDPAMNKSDTAIAERLGVAVIDENERGRRLVVRPTVFFMPHCGKALYQNVLACNWGLDARNLVIIGNSFEAYSDRVLAARERQELLLVRVRPYLEELPLSCGVAKTHEAFPRYEAAFNDLSVHRFPTRLLRRALQDDEELTELMLAVATDKRDLLDGELIAAEAQPQSK